MRQTFSWWRTGVVVVISAATVLIASTVPATTQSATGETPGPPTFLRASHCYRFTFSIAGAPNWKVLDLLPGGWIRAEVDAGPRSAVREPVWVNTAQIITVREAQCSE